MGLFDKNDENDQTKDKRSSDEDDALALALVTGTTVGMWSGSDGGTDEESSDGGDSAAGDGDDGGGAGGSTAVTQGTPATLGS